MADGMVTQDLQQEIALLRAAVARLETTAASRLQFSLNAAATRVFLGQPVVLTVAAQRLAAGPQGAASPARDLPVTLISGWGLLRTVDRYETQIGPSVTTRTGLDGLARATLLPPGALQLESAQQNALRAALETLDPAAPTPAHLSAQLGQLVNDYRWESNMLLRRAIDVLYRYHDLSMAAPVNPDDALTAWRYINATVVAFAGEDGPGLAPEEETVPVPSSAQTTSLQAVLCTVRVADWLPPWLQIYRQQARADEGLARDLTRTGARSAEPGALLDSVYTNIDKYVDSQFGVIGRSVGQSAAESALRTLVSEGLSTVPAETRVLLTPALNVASQTVATAGVHVLSALTQARVDLRQEIDEKAGAAGTLLDGRVGTLEQAVTTKLNASAFQDFEAQIGAQIGDKADAQAVDTLRADLTDQLAARVAVEDFRTFRESNQAELNTKVSTVEITGLRDELSSQIDRKADAAAISGLRDEFASHFAGKADTAAISGLRDEFSAQIARKADRTALDRFQQGIDARFAELATNTSKLGTQLEEFNRALTQLNGRFGDLHSEFITKLDANQTALESNTAAVTQVQSQVGALSNDFTNRLAGLEHKTSGVDTTLTDFQNTLSGLNRDFTRLNKNIRDSGLLRPP